MTARRNGVASTARKRRRGAQGGGAISYCRAGEILFHLGSRSLARKTKTGSHLVTGGLHGNVASAKEHLYILIWLAISS